jgi:hypothetical protein
MIIKLSEINYERSIFKINFKIEEMTFKVDPKQLADLLDFAKFQNYSVFYGIIFSYFINIYFLFFKDRCREYRQLYLQESIGNIKLTQQQKDRIQVKDFIYLY